MNREDIKAMAWAAGLIPDKEPVVYHSFLQESQIYKFAALVAAAATEEANRRANASWSLMCEKMVAAEREACAKVCVELEAQLEEFEALNRAAAAIRARGNP
jgi:hypothetical protein